MGVRRKTALVVLAGVLVGCGQSGVPATSLPKVTAQPAALDLPDQARTDSPAGAAAFVRAFYAQITAAYASGQSDAIRALSLPSCRICLRYADSVDGMRANGERATPVLFVIRFAESPADEDARAARVDVLFDAPASSRYDANGKRLFAEKALFRISRTVTLLRVGRGWKVAGLT